MSQNQQRSNAMPAGKAWEQCYCRTTNPCVIPLEHLLVRSQRTRPLKLKCWQSSLPATSSTNTYMQYKKVVLETDHKPLQAISTMPLSQALLRLHKMLLNLRGYDVEIRYNPGCKEVLADTLSRAGTVKLMKNSRKSTWSCLYRRSGMKSSRKRPK